MGEKMTDRKIITVTSTTSREALAIMPHRGKGDTVSNRNPEVPIGSRDDIREKPDEYNWKQFANCRGMDVNLFFPTRGQHPSVLTKAKAICEGCPVKRACLVVALAAEPDSWGVFGGTTAKTRREIRKQVKRNPDYLYTREACERYGLTDAY
jgi:hypothetical protein